MPAGRPPWLSQVFNPMWWCSRRRSEMPPTSHPLRQLEPKHAGIERERAVQIRNLEMDVPDVRA